ncbi:MAG: hypothetical protein SFT68_01090 [Rickettsiaceae bacterium]|nr:hypothetical protein [Rickettsiaceae bacterium]
MIDDLTDFTEGTLSLATSHPPSDNSYDTNQEDLQSNIWQLVSNFFSQLNSSATSPESSDSDLQGLDTSNSELSDKETSSSNSGVKSFDELIEELSSLNSDFSRDLISNIKTDYEQIIERYDSPSLILSRGRNPCNIPIKDWDIANIKQWCNVLRGRSAETIGQESDLSDLENNSENTDRSDSRDELNSDIIQEDEVLDDKTKLIEILAVVKRASSIANKQDPREVQMISVLLALADNERGSLLEIATGEGKSLIVAMLASVKALLGHKVDVITSSPVLAERDLEEKLYFFKILGLDAYHNISSGMNSRKAPKECYKCDIVYGDLSNFQYDYLSTEYNQYNTKNGREFDVCIVDEVDNMLVDEANKSALIGSTTPGMDKLREIYLAVWGEYCRLNESIIYDDEIYGYKLRVKYKDGSEASYLIGDKNSFIKSQLREYIKLIAQTGKISGLEVPKFLLDYIELSARSWPDSIVSAAAFGVNKHYCSRNNQELQVKVITPIDYQNTGLLSTSLNWSNGLHQFLQIKEGLHIQPESFRSCFISNLSYILKYGKNIYGLSGTLGSEDSRHLLEEVYNVNLYNIPTFKIKNFDRYNEIICYDTASWINAITDTVKKISIGSDEVISYISKTSTKIHYHLSQAEVVNLDNRAFALQHNPGGGDCAIYAILSGLSGNSDLRATNIFNEDQILSTRKKLVDIVSNFFALQEVYENTSNIIDETVILETAINIYKKIFKAFDIFKKVLLSFYDNLPETKEQIELCADWIGFEQSKILFEILKRGDHNFGLDLKSILVDHELIAHLDFDPLKRVVGAIECGFDAIFVHYFCRVYSRLLFV